MTRSPTTEGTVFSYKSLITWSWAAEISAPVRPLPPAGGAGAFSGIGAVSGSPGDWGGAVAGAAPAACRAAVLMAGGGVNSTAGSGAGAPAPGCPQATASIRPAAPAARATVLNTLRL